MLAIVHETTYPHGVNPSERMPKLLISHVNPNS